MDDLLVTMGTLSQITPCAPRRFVLPPKRPPGRSEPRHDVSYPEIHAWNQAPAGWKSTLVKIIFSVLSSTIKRKIRALGDDENQQNKELHNLNTDMVLNPKKNDRTSG